MVNKKYIIGILILGLVLVSGCYSQEINEECLNNSDCNTSEWNEKCVSECTEQLLTSLSFHKCIEGKCVCDCREGGFIWKK